jgi:hypothetical protein
MDEYLSFIINALLFFLAFKAGQISMVARLDRRQIERAYANEPKITAVTRRPVITVEEINGIYYAYDGNDFLAQGATPNELGSLIADRFPNKYASAKIDIKA